MAQVSSEGIKHLYMFTGMPSMVLSPILAMCMTGGCRGSKEPHDRACGRCRG